MSEESFFSIRMTKMSDSELKKYVDNKDEFQDYAVLAAVLELEKRGVSVENGAQIKQEISEVEVVEKEVIGEPIEFESTASTTTPELYSTQSIFIFGALFSVFGGGILMLLNLFKLNKRNSGWYVIIGSIVYSFSLSYIYRLLNISDKVLITNLVTIDDIIIALFISVISNLFGVYLLYYFIWNKEVPSNLNYRKKAIWKPILIILAINIVAGLLLMGSGNFPQP